MNNQLIKDQSCLNSIHSNRIEYTTNHRSIIYYRHKAKIISYNPHHYCKLRVVLNKNLSKRNWNEIELRL